MIDNIYEWLYDHYCRPYQKQVRDPAASHIQSAEQLLIYGGGDHLDREDALAVCRRATGVTALAAGMYVAYRLMADLDFLDN